MDHNVTDPVPRGASHTSQDKMFLSDVTTLSLVPQKLTQVLLPASKRPSLLTHPPLLTQSLSSLHAILKPANVSMAVSGENMAACARMHAVRTVQNLTVYRQESVSVDAYIESMERTATCSVAAAACIRTATRMEHAPMAALMVFMETLVTQDVARTASTTAADRIPQQEHFSVWMAAWKGGEV